MTRPKKTKTPPKMFYLPARGADGLVHSIAAYGPPQKATQELRGLVQRRALYVHMEGFPMWGTEITKVLKVAPVTCIRCIVGKRP